MNKEGPANRKTVSRGLLNAPGAGVVRMEGLEPPHLAASDPKSDVSTNFTTSGKDLFESGPPCWLASAFRFGLQM